MKQMTKEWIYLTISVVGGLSVGSVLAMLRGILGTF
ncbi:hypothetical protein LCGC14_1515120 [marine sediment metagenome]|uniref:Uncharacterized protein n=1 Tax=marine sediment metagenome TaxID=412755 RepID=A0A0F9J0H4_9ZZZZ